MKINIIKNKTTNLSTKHLNKKIRFKTLTQQKLMIKLIIFANVAKEGNLAQNGE